MEILLRKHWKSRYLDVDPGFPRGVGKTPLSSQDESCAPKYHNLLRIPDFLMSWP